MEKIFKFACQFQKFASASKIEAKIDIANKEFFSSLNKEISLNLNKLKYNEEIIGKINVVFNGKDLSLPIKIYTKDFKKDLPNLLIVSGFHGDEIGGPLGILKFLEEYGNDYLDKANISFFPIANPIGFLKMRRWGLNDHDINRGFIKGKSEKISHEGSILKNNKSLWLKLAKDGMMDLHEDPDGNECFIYVWENSKHSGTYAKDARNFAGKFFNVSPKNTLKAKDKYTDAKGIIHNDSKGTFEEWLFDEGIPHVLTTETPGMELLSKRINANSKMIKHFIDYHIEFK